MRDDRHDVVVIGGGPAGLSAALGLGRARRSVLVVDGGEPRNAPAEQMHNDLGRGGAPPRDLLAAGRAEVARYGGELVSGDAVAARPDAGGLAVDLADGRTVRTRRLLVTTGLVDELPEVPGVPEPTDDETFPRSALVVAPRSTARSGVLASLGLLPVDQEIGGHVHGSAVPADPSGATAVPGVWVAGNVTDLRAQVITSAAAGLDAAVAINADLIGEDTRRAVAAREAGPFSAAAEREVCEQVLGDRRHGI